MITGGIALIVMGIAAGMFGTWALSDDRDWLILVSGYRCYRYWWVLEIIGIGLLLSDFATGRMNQVSSGSRRSIFVQPADYLCRMAYSCKACTPACDVGESVDGHDTVYHRQVAPLSAGVVVVLLAIGGVYYCCRSTDGKVPPFWPFLAVHIPQIDDFIGSVQDEKTSIGAIGEGMYIAFVSSQSCTLAACSNVEKNYLSGATLSEVLTLEPKGQGLPIGSKCQNVSARGAGIATGSRVSRRLQYPKE